MDPFGMTPDQYTAGATWVAAIAAAGTLFVLIATALYARGQFKEAKEMRLIQAELQRAQTRPFVVPYLDVEQQTLLMFKVENLGTMPAYNIHLRFDKPPRSLLGKMENLRILKEPIPTMPPRQTFRTYWESLPQVFDGKKPYPHALYYQVFVTYDDHLGHTYKDETYVLDFRVYQSQAAVSKGTAELVKATEELVKEHKKWTDGSRGIRVNAANALTVQHRDNRPGHFRKAKQEYTRKGWKGAVGYWIEVWRLRRGLWMSR